MPHAANDTAVSESRMMRIARRAHEIYVARGGEHGKAIEDWLAAEREIDAQLTRSNDDDVASQA